MNGPGPSRTLSERYGVELRRQCTSPLEQRQLGEFHQAGRVVAPQQLAHESLARLLVREGKVFDWDLDRIEVLDDSNNEFVPLWSDDPDYTLFLTRYEHTFHQSCVRAGDTGAQTAEDKANRRAEGLLRAWSDLEGGPFKIAKVAAAVLECAEVRERAKNVKDDPDFGDFSQLLMLTDIGGKERNDVPLGPSMARTQPEAEPEPPAADPAGAVVPDYGGLEEGFRSNQQMLEADLDEDLDEGIPWRNAGTSDADPVGHDNGDR